jgi:hypothetical protein
MSVRAASIGILIAAVLSGCAAIDSTVAPRYDTVSRNFAEARNEAILLNIVRAAHDDPLSFSAISQAIPQTTNGTSLGLPQFFEGPKFCPTPTTCTLGSSGPQRGFVFGNSVASDTVTLQTQFTLSTQETHDFYEALLRPVDLYTVNFFIRQGYPPELLFWLFAERVDVQRGSQTFGVQYSPAFNYGCPLQPVDIRCFRDWAEIATITGLSVEEQAVISADKRANDKGGKREYVGRVCFDSVLAAQGTAEMEEQDPALYHYLFTKYLAGGRVLRTLSPRCGTPWIAKISRSQATDTLDFHVNGITFRIVPRSPYGIYRFLGQLLRQSMSGRPIVPPKGFSDEQTLPELTTVPGDKKILDIVRDAGSDCFVWTHFEDGDYCVPHYADNTKQIIGLLAALTALQTSATDLAITPVVHTAD